MSIKEAIEMTSKENRCVALIFYWLSCVLTGIHALRCFYLFCVKPFKFLREKENITEIIQLSSVISYLVLSQSSIEASTQIGSFAVLLTWIRITLLIGRFPTFGIYIYMCTYICSTLLMFFTLYMTTLFGKQKTCDV